MTDDAPWVVYALRLEGGKYYVGTTNRPRKRLQQHFDGDGAVWTKAHPPIEVAQRIPAESKGEALGKEEWLTKKYAEKHGRYLVRGGPWVAPGDPPPAPEDDGA